MNTKQLTAIIPADSNNVLHQVASGLAAISSIVGSPKDQKLAWMNKMKNIAIILNISIFEALVLSPAFIIFSVPIDCINCFCQIIYFFALKPAFLVPCFVRKSLRSLVIKVIKDSCGLSGIWSNRCVLLQFIFSLFHAFSHTFFLTLFHALLESVIQ